MKKRKAKSRRRAKLFRFYLPVAAAAIVVLGIGAGILRSRRAQPDVSRGLAALHSAYRDQRPVQSRLSGFEYAPVRQERGGPTKIDDFQHDRAGSILLEAAGEPSAIAHHALGQYYLFEKQFDKSIDQLDAALKLDPRNAQAHSDLGAALLELGKTRAADPEPGKQIEEFGSALEHLERASELDGSLLPPVFNRALLYQGMKLPRSEADAWQQYLERDPGSQWADESRQQLKTLKETPPKTSQSADQAVQNFLSAREQGDDDKAWSAVSWNYTSAGNTIANSLLDSYLELESKSDPGADGKLQELQHLAQLEWQRSGDRYTSDLVRFYENSSPQQRLELTRARAQIRKGYELFLRSNLDLAVRNYTQARDSFAQIGDEGEATFADYLLGHCYLLQLDLKQSDETLARVRAVCERRNYRWLLNQSLYRTASVRLAYNEYSESIDYANRALKQSEQIPDNITVIKLLILLGDQYRALNNQAQSLNYFVRALSLADAGAVEPLQTWGIFTGIALNLNALGSHRAALEYQKEALRLAREMDRPLIISRSYDYLGLTYASLGAYPEALTNIELAFDAAKSVADEPSGREMMANSSLHAGDVHRQFGDFDQAVAAYDRSMRVYEDFGYTYFTYPAHKGKLLTFMAQGNDRAAEEEIRTVMALFEHLRSRLTQEEQQNTFFDVEQSIYDLSIDFARSKKHDESLAYDYSELSRARSLGAAMRQREKVSARDGSESRMPPASLPLRSPAIRQRMPPQSQIIQYAVLDNKLLIWVVSQEKVSAVEVPLDAKTLNQQVDAYLRGVNEPSASRAAETAQAAQKLYDLLIKPVEPLLDKTKLLCIVPDKFLHYLPFAAIISPETGHYLVQDFSLTQSPSSTVFVECSEEARRKIVSGEEKLLSVGDPSFDRNAFPTLDRLPTAGQEAEAVAGFYHASRLLLRERATEQAVRNEIAKANVLHFALHYVVDKRSSLLSQMALAPPRPADVSDSKDARKPEDTRKPEDDDGIWQVREIVQTKLPQARLAVLSACQTGIERQYRGEGAISIARPFLIAGVPLVVASLWPVDTQSTEKLMVSFHQHRVRDHLPSAAALRQAQLEMITGDDTRYRQPYYWAAFTAIGGYTEY